MLPTPRAQEIAQLGSWERNMKTNEDYLQSQIGNPDGSDVPNKKYYDPRGWLRKGENTFVERLKKAFEDLNNVNTL